MRTMLSVVAVAAATLITGAASVGAQGDPKGGARAYRACAACHSLEPNIHLTGPSLAGLWGKRAGKIESFARYSKALKAADIVWDENTLNAWLAHPNAFVPGNRMTFRGIKDDKVRGDLIAFLREALAPGGSASVVEQRLISKDLAEGQRPESLGDLEARRRVTGIRHCRGTYFIATADGTETAYWEMNVRLKTDTASTGRKPGQPALVGAGMMGDRVSIVFADPGEIASMVKSKC